MRTPSAVALTDERVKRFKLPATGRRWIHDAKQPGLRLLVTSAGARRWYDERRIAGKPTRTLIGDAEQISIADARAASKKIAAEAIEGRSRHAAKQVVRRDPTLAEVWQVIRGQHLPLRRPATRLAWESIWRKHLSPWAGRRLRSIKPSDVRALHAKIGEIGATTAANALLKLLSALYSLAGKLLDAQVESPAKRVERFAESARTEFVRIEQFPALWAAIEAADRDVGDFLKMLLLTGQRPDQVCGMRWADVDLDTGAWIVAGSGTKAARRYEIPPGAAGGRAAWADAEVELLHNVPSLVNEPDPGQRLYFWETTQAHHAEWALEPGHENAKTRMATYYQPLWNQVEPLIREMKEQASA